MEQPKSGIFTQKVRRLARQTSWLVVAKATIMVNAVVVTIWIARHLGPSDYGIFSYALAVLALARPLVGFGLSNIVLRDIKLDGSQTDAILGATTFLRACGSLLAGALALALVGFSSVDHPNFALLCGILVVSSMFAAPRGVEYFFAAQQNSRPFVLGLMVATAIVALVKIGLILSGAGVEAFVLATAAESIAIGVASLVVYARAGRNPRRWIVSRQWVVTYLRRGGVLMFGGFAHMVATKLDIIMVAELAGTVEAGIYAAASRISIMIFNLPTAFATAVFPALIELEKTNRARYLETLQLTLDGLAAAALMAALTVTVIAAPVIGFLLGPSYLPSAEILVIHVWVCLFLFTRAMVDNWLISRALDALLVRVHIGNVVINIALNLMLIPMYGAKGAAYAILISFAASTLLVLGLDRRGRPILGMVIKALLTWPVRLPLLARRILARGRGR